VTNLHLASSSARRVDILTALGVPFTAAGVDIDETPLAGEDVQAMALRLAKAKARAAAIDREGAVLGADTAVALQGRIFGKPRSEAHALEMLSALSSRTHEVLTAVFLARTDRPVHTVGIESTRVTFGDFGEPTIRRYVETGEPMDKAGAYGIQGGGADLVDHVDGSWSNVVGLPLERIETWLAEIGVSLAQLGGGVDGR